MSARPHLMPRGYLAILVALAAFAAFPALSEAATITVNTTADSPPGPGQCEGAAEDCSLRQAIDVANGEGGSNTIVLPAGQYDLTIPPAGGTPNDSGDLDTLNELTIEGAGARKSVIDASGIEDRVFYVEEEAGLDLVGLTVTGGRTDEEGGGIFVEEEADLNLDGVAVTDNEAYGDSSGGGIASFGETLHIVDSVISDNRNSGDGGGIYADLKELVIEDSTIADNVVDTALYPASSTWGAFGGGMEAEGENLVLKNDTISGNQIISANGSGHGFASAIHSEFAHGEVANTIVADNTETEVDNEGQCNEALGSLGHNLESAEPAGEPRCFEGPTDLIADPLLAPLANNGGETDTAALMEGSPAIDAGDPALCLPADQRGVARPMGAGCDIGAFEFVPAPPPVTPETPKVETKTTPPAPTPSAPTCKVPKLKGKKLKAAKKAIKAADCKLGKVTKKNGVTSKTGKVTKQSPKVGASKAVGAKVNVTLG